MKTVRLPIFEDGVETRDYLEVDVTFWISPTRGIRSNQARIIEYQEPEWEPPVQEPLADWEKLLLNSKIDESWDDVLEKVLDQHGVAKREVLEKIAPAEEWKTIDTLPTKSFEVNQRGQVRIKTSKKILEPSLDLDSKNYMTVNVKINGLDFYINGPKLAEQLWSRAV